MRIRFDRGTLVLEAQEAGEAPELIAGAVWDPELRGWRVPAERYAVLVKQLAMMGVRISDETRERRYAFAWQLAELRWYQRAALERWQDAGCRGVVALPTGSGKTLVALTAMMRLGVATLVLVPTRLLLDQWVRVLKASTGQPIGRLGDGEHVVASITVSTYASAATWAPRVGDRFGLVVVDEAHHVGAWCATEIFELLIAPARLGLTAVPPDDPGALAAHLGPTVFMRSAAELRGDGLADYELISVPIVLEDGEGWRYRALRGRFAASYAAFQRATPSAAWSEYVRAASRTVEGRAALAAWRDYRSLLAYSTGKRAALRRVLAAHPGRRALVFTGDNATAYEIARELLVMPITYEIKRTERMAAIDGFRSGERPVLVSAQVLDEGFDVPDADLAIVVGGTSSARRHAQRIGRVLRPRDGKRALVYELAVVDSAEMASVERRHRGMTDPTGDAGSRWRAPSGDGERDEAWTSGAGAVS